LGDPHIPFLGLIKRSYHDWLSIRWRCQRPPFQPWPRPPMPTFTTVCEVVNIFAALA